MSHEYKMDDVSNINLKPSVVKMIFITLLVACDTFFCLFCMRFSIE